MRSQCSIKIKVIFSSRPLIIKLYKSNNQNRSPALDHREPTFSSYLACRSLHTVPGTGGVYKSRGAIKSVQIEHQSTNYLRFIVIKLFIFTHLSFNFVSKFLHYLHQFLDGLDEKHICVNKQFLYCAMRMVPYQNSVIQMQCDLKLDEKV